MKSIAIVLLNYNGIDLLKKFLNDVISNSLEADIVLIDNNSIDNSVRWFKNQYPKLQCIELKENYGFAKGYNKGLKQVKHEYYGLLNTDVWVPSGWLKPLLKSFDTFNNVAIIQPHILNQKKPNYFEYAGAAGGYIDKYGIPFCRGRIINKLEEDLGQYDKNEEIFWASGACFLIRSQVFWELEGFDNDFFAHQEEIDLCWRAYNQGYKNLAVGSSKVYHIGGATLPLSAKKVYLNHKNSLNMILKNVPSKNRFTILAYRLILDGAIGLFFLFRLKISFTWAIIRAHFSFYKRFKSVKLKNNIQIKKDDYFFIKNILFEYYIKRTRYFTDLDK